MGAEAAAGIASGLIGMFGARSQRRWDARQAEINRNWQERMSNTAVSRRMADLANAGINPILAARHDANTPAGSLAHASPNTAQAGIQSGTAVAGTALAIQRQKQELKNLQAEEEATREGTVKTKADTAVSEARRRLMKFGGDVAAVAAFGARMLMSSVEGLDEKQAMEKLQAWVSRTMEDIGNRAPAQKEAIRRQVETIYLGIVDSIPGSNTDYDPNRIDLSRAEWKRQMNMRPSTSKSYYIWREQQEERYGLKRTTKGQ